MLNKLTQVFVFVEGGNVQATSDAEGNPPSVPVEIFDFDNDEAGQCVVCQETRITSPELPCHNCGYNPQAPDRYAEARRAYVAKYGGNADSEPEPIPAAVVYAAALREALDALDDLSATVQNWEMAEDESNPGHDIPVIVAAERVLAKYQPVLENKNETTLDFAKRILEDVVNWSAQVDPRPWYEVKGQAKAFLETHGYAPRSA